MLVAVGSRGGLRVVESWVVNFQAGFSHENQASLVITFFSLSVMLEEALDMEDMSIAEVKKKEKGLQSMRK